MAFNSISKTLLRQVQSCHFQSSFNSIRLFSMIANQTFNNTSSFFPKSMDLKQAFVSPETYSGLRKPLEESTSLFAEAYTSQEFFDLEMEKVYRNKWVYIGAAEQVKSHGDVLPIEVAGEPLLITNHRGKIHCFYNLCRHRGSRLVKEACKKSVICCPYHHWGYSLKGDLKATPLWKVNDDDEEPSEEMKRMVSLDLKNFCKEENGLIPVRIDTWGGLLYVNVSGTAPPLREYLGHAVTELQNYPLEDLVVAHSRTFHINANWKLMAENGCEFYHLTAVHPELAAVSNLEHHKVRQGEGMYVAYNTYPLTPANTPLDPDIIPTYPGLTADEKITAYFCIQFPNFISSYYPHHAYLVQIVPISPTETIEHASLFVHPEVYNDKSDETQEKILKMCDFQSFVNDQDISVLEELQKGLHVRGYKGGRFSFQFESGTHRFQNMIADAMTGH